MRMASRRVGRRGSRLRLGPGVARSAGSSSSSAAASTASAVGVLGRLGAALGRGLLRALLELRARCPGTPRRARRRGRRRCRSGRRTRPARRSRSSSRHCALAVLGQDLGAERPVAPSTSRSSSSSTMIRSPRLAHQPRGRLLELVEQAGLALLAALLEVEREVVQRERGALLVVRVEHRGLAGGPRVGGARVGRRRRPSAERLLGRDAGRAQQVVGRRRLGGEARRPRGPPRRTRRTPRPGCRARSSSDGGVDDLGVGHPLAGVGVLVAAADAERAVGGDREVVGVVVDQRQPAELRDPVAVAVEELAPAARSPGR